MDFKHDNESMPILPRAQQDANARLPLKLSRRSFVQIGALSCFGLREPSTRALALSQTISKAKRAILVWLDGGPSHLDTFDPKPDASAEVRGPFKTIATAIPGIRFTELLPQTAKLVSKLSIIRSITSPLGEHNLGTQYMLTGYKPTPAIEYPVVGSIVNHLDRAGGELPNFVAIPDHRVGGARFAPHGFLSPIDGPFEIKGNPSKSSFQVRDLDYFPELNESRIQRRRQLLDGIDHESFAQGNLSHKVDHHLLDQAIGLITSQNAHTVFDLRKESEATRQRYGAHSLGQSCLLARRLIESGVRFVTVTNPGWDTHDNAYTRLKEGFTGATVPVGLVPKLDQSISSLIIDLEDRGLLDDTLILVMGEFGRTPKVNVQGGRDHWPRVFSVLLAGGGVPGGQIIGSSDRDGESPKDDPVTPEDLAATVYQLLGFDPKRELITSDGRPIRLSRDGNLIRHILG